MERHQPRKKAEVFRQIHTSLWSESWFEPLSVEAKLLFLYLVTHPMTSAAGFVPITTERITFETKLGPAIIQEVLAELENKVLSCPEGLWVKRYPRWQGGGGPNWAKAVAKATESLPPMIKAAYLSQYPSEPLPYPSDTPPKPFPYPSGKRKEKHKHKQNPVTKDLLIPGSISNSSDARARAETPSATTAENLLGLLSQGYEATIGLLNSAVSDQLREYADEYRGELEWIPEAFAAATAANVRRWSYVKKILDTCQDEGRAPSDGTGRRNSGQNQAIDYAREWGITKKG